MIRHVLQWTAFTPGQESLSEGCPCEFVNWRPIPMRSFKRLIIISSGWTGQTVLGCWCWRESRLDLYTAALASTLDPYQSNWGVHTGSGTCGVGGRGGFLSQCRHANSLLYLPVPISSLFWPTFGRGIIHSLDNCLRGRIVVVSMQITAACLTCEWVGGRSLILEWRFNLMGWELFTY